ncbi:hypothetical protein M0813_07534 [Anaeramoeba flamelloides]|uniref:Uncharacterized protein n=1 Tax=Anaeramoeba flamelloides TaxID=1746091 RepID=A0ABQ8XAU0_9EUKA|nr:hypothetical protein M0813_07534 [Anaeramoeba flamelloides]
MRNHLFEWENRKYGKNTDFRTHSEKHNFQKFDIIKAEEIVHFLKDIYNENNNNLEILNIQEDPENDNNNEETTKEKEKKNFKEKENIQNFKEKETEQSKNKRKRQITNENEFEKNKFQNIKKKKMITRILVVKKTIHRRNRKK